MLRLRDAREDHDLKQEEIAKILKISRQYYSRYELGQVELPIRHYITLAKFYNVSIDYLAGVNDDPDPLYRKTKTAAQSKDRTAELVRKIEKLIEEYK